MPAPEADRALPSLYVVILNWNHPQDTLACLESVRHSHYKNLGIVVVDNGSSDDSVALIQKAFSDVLLLENGTNLGYAGGNNVGIYHALNQGAEFVVLLNDDVLVEEETFDRLVASAKEPAVAAVGCKVRLFGDAKRLWAAGECFPRGQEYPADDGRFDTPGEIRYAVGCCILIRRSALLDVGLLDEDFFCVHEEQEWCYRARKAGYAIVYAPDAVVQHKVSASLTSSFSPTYHYLFVRNLLRLNERRGNMPRGWRRLWAVLWVWQQELTFIGAHGACRLRRGWGATRGALDYVLGRFGPPPGL
jgi:GT2 family glycosyltransferase